MDTFTQLTVDGLTLGSVYALIALGYTLVYGVLKLLNFAHGDVFMVGTFVGYGVLQALGGPMNPSLPIWIVIAIVTIAAMAVCAGLGVAIERFAYRPLRDAPRIAPLISALGVSFFLANSMQLLFGATPRNYDLFEYHDRLPLPARSAHRQRDRAAAADHHDLRRVRADGRPLVPRQPDAHRQGDSRHLVRPRSGSDDGHRHRQGDRLHVHPRRRAGRRRGRRCSRCASRRTSRSASSPASRASSPP